jgi:hypothetical protein
MIDYPEMQCYCDSRKVHDKKCTNMIPYKHHHDWGDDSDFTCEDCLEFCGDKK